MITKLTEKQWQQIETEKQRWIAIGTCTRPADRETTERVISAFYERVGSKPPRFVWCDGPLSCLESVKEANILYLAFRGAEYCWWVGWFAILRDVVGVTYTEEQNALLREWETLVQACGWWFPLDDVCYCAERHQAIHFDGQGRLHCEDGPAVLCRDGFAIYSWHGTVVPEKLVMRPDEITQSDLQTEENSEIQRVYAEKLGHDRYLRLLGVQVHNEWTDPTTALTYQLLEPSRRFGEQQPRYLRMRSPVLNDGSSPWYVEPVDPRLKSAQAARRWQLEVTWPESDADGLVAECNKNPGKRFDIET